VDRVNRRIVRYRSELPRELWLVVLGIFLNYVGYGAVLPFEIIYLHDGRGFGLGVAGLVIGLITGVAVGVAPLAGPLIDRFGARAVATGGGVALAVGYCGLALAHTPAAAFVVAAIAGAANVGAGLGAGLGGLVAAYGLTGFVVLFLANGVSYLVYVGILVALVRDGDRPEPMTGGYRLVVRDGAFVHLALINVAVIAVGWGIFTWLVPPYAKHDLHVDARLIGVLLLANTAAVAVAQVPVARLAEGRRRVVTMAWGAGTFALACLFVLAAGAGLVAAYPALLAAVILVGIGECLHTTVLMPLVADLAPAALRGRYMAAMGLSWWIGLAVAPAMGVPLLDASPAAAFSTAAG